jgi:hypothetical protein
MGLGWLGGAGVQDPHLCLPRPLCRIQEDAQGSPEIVETLIRPFTQAFVQEATAGMGLPPAFSMVSSRASQNRKPSILAGRTARS